ncbi:DNA polymerase III subunit epsilon [Mucilaginibacter daejeonensis]|uniref:3'-5' exonuclease n=1 Tax=Mucilaginibacter daejeonensis TaxID=398049 RepID=UPI001D176633|nr:3'-5' exonuclease [Mucilaginibacter daejeonensis]UEG54735.1 DNA polymerase III subunit epsilon [Mucilaginibacter daejeonensis]
MTLNLKRPLAFFDIEATGANIGTDRIIEIAIIKMLPDGTEQSKTWVVNPGMPIPLETSLIHGFYDEHVKDAQLFAAVGTEIAEFIGDADLAGYNSNKFDIPMLMEEFLKAGVSFDLSARHFVDVQNIFHQMEQRTLKAAYQFYCQKDIVNAHSAEADARATMEVLLAQVERYKDSEFVDKKGNKTIPVQNEVAALHEFTNMQRAVDFVGRMVYNEAGEEVFNFGKHKGKRVTDVFDVEPSYYAWMMQGDFPLYTKQKLKEIYDRWIQARPPRPAQPKPAPADGGNQQGEKKPFQKPFNKQQPYNKPPQQQQQRPYKKPDEPAKPVNEDMLQALANKFKKS